VTSFSEYDTMVNDIIIIFVQRHQVRKGTCATDSQAADQLTSLALIFPEITTFIEPEFEPATGG